MLLSGLAGRAKRGRNLYWLPRQSERRGKRL